MYHDKLTLLLRNKPFQQYRFKTWTLKKKAEEESGRKKRKKKAEEEEDEEEEEKEAEREK